MAKLAQGARLVVTIWMCPNCSNYYGSTNAGDLSKKWNVNMKGERTFKRSICPDCRQNGQLIERVPVQL